MEELNTLAGHLLISLPAMSGDYFSHTVTLLIDHDDQGAFGLVINRPLASNLAELLADHDLVCERDISLLEMGPVEQTRLFFLHSNDLVFESSIAINERLLLSTSPDLIDHLATGSGPKQILAGLGYAGWGPGQLEEEIKADVWLITPYNHDIIFDTPFDLRPQAAARSIGVELNLIAPTPGHG